MNRTATAKLTRGSGIGRRRAAVGVLVATVASLLGLSVVGTAAATSKPGTGAEVERVWGEDRYATSLAAARRFVAAAGGRIDAAVVVPGAGWHDAVAAAGLAGALNAPMLLSPPEGLSSQAGDLLGTAGVTHVVVVDGGGELLATGLDRLRRQFARVERIGGGDPAAVSAKSALRLATPGGFRNLGRTAILANSDEFVDGMVAGAVAWRGHHPVLLTPSGRLAPAVGNVLGQLRVDHVMVMGGPAAISDEIVGELLAAGMSTTRVGGATRFETALALADFTRGAYAAPRGAECFGSSAVGIATARSPYDSLSAAPLLGRLCAPLLLSSQSSADRATVEWIRDRSRSVLVFGGTAAVSAAAAAVLDAEAPTFIALDAGSKHTCAVRVGGALTCWGDNSHGQLNTPNGTFTAIAAGWSHSCAVRVGGALACWGDNSRGQLDTPNGTFTAVAAGGVGTRGAAVLGFACALRTNGDIACWGDDSYGQVSGAPEGSFVAIAAGWGHACAVRSDETLACWGADTQGQVSNAPAGTFSDVAAGAWHSCARRSNGELACWGADFNSEASPPSGTHVSTAAGASFSCAVRTDGALRCWGFDGTGQVSQAPAAGDFRLVTAGSWHACALRGNGEAVCWGDNAEGQSAPPLVAG